MYINLICRVQDTWAIHRNLCWNLISGVNNWMTFAVSMDRETWSLSWLKRNEPLQLASNIALVLKHHWTCFLLAALSNNIFSSYQLKVNSNLPRQPSWTEGKKQLSGYHRGGINREKSTYFILVDFSHSL